VCGRLRLRYCRFSDLIASCIARPIARSRMAHLLAANMIAVGTTPHFLAFAGARIGKA